MKCAVIGSTGWQGTGVAIRIVHAGHTALLGTRDLSRAQRIVDVVPGKVDLPQEKFIAMDNLQAAEEADMVFITVPMTAHEETLHLIKDKVQGKIVVDVTAPVNPDNQIENMFPPQGSATEQAQEILGEDVEVVGALKNISAAALMNINKEPNCDILVIGDDLTAKHRVMGVLRKMGLNSYDVGSGDVCHTVEGLTSMLIYLNYAYHLRLPGVTIAQIDPGLDFIPDESLFVK